MTELIHDLLAYTTTEHATLDLRPVDLTELAEEVAGVHADRLAAAAAADPDRGVQPPQLYVGRLPRVHGDPVRLRQLLDNLVGNAIKYSPDDRPARVDVTAEPRPDGRLEITVADRGIGIPEGQHAKVFQRFFRVAEHVARPGTGLGLAICQRIVELHGGTISAVDNPGGGTRVVFTLPPAQSPGETEAETGALLTHAGPGSA
jgi:signal transduction histidine kinase